MEPALVLSAVAFLFLAALLLILRVRVTELEHAVDDLYLAEER